LVRSTVDWLAETGLTTGSTPSTYGSEDLVTRAQMATFLWRLADSPVSTADGPAFDDAPAGSYYSTAVVWLAGEGITNGVGPGKYGPDDAVTRAQMAAFLYRYDNRP